jgi:hypothetical protein
VNNRSSAKSGDLRLMARSSTSGQGRKKGVPNKQTKAIKDMLLGALADAGGQAYLTGQAKTNSSAFLALLGRIVPQELKAELETKSTVIVVERSYGKPKQ